MNRKTYFFFKTLIYGITFLFCHTIIFGQQHRSEQINKYINSQTLSHNNQNIFDEEFDLADVGDNLNLRNNSDDLNFSETDNPQNAPQIYPKRHNRRHRNNYQYEQNNNGENSYFSKFSSWANAKLNAVQETVTDTLTNKTIKAIFNEIEDRYLKNNSKYLKPTALSAGALMLFLIGYKIGHYKSQKEYSDKINNASPNPYIRTSEFGRY